MGNFISCAFNFNITAGAGLWGPYDFDSFMHYGRTAFSCTGSDTITVTPAMVGTRLAVFCSIEVKTPTGRVRPEQQAWLEAVHQAGGIAGIARSVTDAKALLSNLPT